VGVDESYFTAAVCYLRQEMDIAYESDSAICREWAQRHSCTKNEKAQKTITRHVWEDVKE